MARRIVTRRELKALAADAQPKRAKKPRIIKGLTAAHADPTLRPLKLNDALMATYLSWCPVPIVLETTPANRQPPVRGRLTLRMQQLGGLREQWELVGTDGWLVMEAARLQSEPREAYLICGVVLAHGNKPGRVVAPSHLWRLWQPSFAPTFEGSQTFSDQPSGDIWTVLNGTLDKHLAESFSEWSSRALLAEHAAFDARIKYVSDRISALDKRRRERRRSVRGCDSEALGIRKELVDAEQLLADLGEARLQVRPPPPQVIRQRLCEVLWVVKAPGP